MERDDLTHDEWLEHLQHELMDAIVYVQRLRTREQTIEVRLRKLLAIYLQASESKHCKDNYRNSESAMWGYIVDDLKRILDEVSE